MKILILGVNGFIGSHLVEKILATTDWEIYGLDLSDHKLGSSLDHPRCNFTKGDMTKSHDRISSHITTCDVVLPLAAIATPATYIEAPLKVFELDFEENLKIVRLCVQHQTRVVFPSTSEVYGMCQDEEFDEQTSPLVTGPIAKERWIYSSSKQLMDRIIYAYGKHNNLSYSIFRPFNWYGPKLDDINIVKKGGSRVITQFIGNILRGESISLVDGGAQKRSFCYIDDAIAALIKIIANENNCADNCIFNIGNPGEELSIKELATALITIAKEHNAYNLPPGKEELIAIASKSYYGSGYQDMTRRVPAIKNAKEKLSWQPAIGTAEGLRQTFQYYLAQEVV